MSEERNVNPSFINRNNPSEVEVNIPTDNNEETAETFTSRIQGSFEGRINRPVTELDYAPTERKGLIRLKNIPESLKRITSDEEIFRSPKVRQKEIERLNRKASTAGLGIHQIYTATELERSEEKAPSVTEPEKSPRVPSVTVRLNSTLENSRKKFQQPKPGEEEPLPTVAEALFDSLVNISRAGLFGRRPLSESEKAGMTDEQIKEAEVFSLTTDMGAITATVDMLNTFSSYLGQGISEAQLYALALTPFADTLVGSESMENTFSLGPTRLGGAVGRTILDKVMDTLGGDYTAGTTNEILDVITTNRDSLKLFTDEVGKGIHSIVVGEQPKDVKVLMKNYLRGLGVPAKDMNSFLAATAVAGSFAPFGFFRFGLLFLVVFLVVFLGLSSISLKSKDN